MALATDFLISDKEFERFLKKKSIQSDLRKHPLMRPLTELFIRFGLIPECLWQGTYYNEGKNLTPIDWTPFIAVEESKYVKDRTTLDIFWAIHSALSSDAPEHLHFNYEWLFVSNGFRWELYPRIAIYEHQRFNPPTRGVLRELHEDLPKLYDVIGEHWRRQYKFDLLLDYKSCYKLVSDYYKQEEDRQFGMLSKSMKKRDVKLEEQRVTDRILNTGMGGDGTPPEV